MKRILILILLAAAVTSCIPTSRLTYLQEVKGSPNDSIVVAARKVQPPYRFQINDILNISIRIPSDPILEQLFSATGEVGGSGGGLLYFSGYTIDVHGNIRMPQLGYIKAVNLTADELRLSISKELDKFIRNDGDYFIRVKIDGLSYTLTGEVSGAGQQKVYVNQLNVIEAISNAGGVPITGDLTNVRVIRQSPTGIRKLNFDLTDIAVLSSSEIMVQQNDIIVVNPLPQKSLGIGTNGFSTFTTVFGIATGLIGLLLIINNTNN